jgi:PAS domain S-box-containing protein
MRGVLEAVGSSLEMEFAAYWKVVSRGEPMACVETWKRDDQGNAQFEEITQGSRFESGIGLPGRVWSGGEPVWITDVIEDANFPRARFAVQAGLHTGIAFPIVRDAHVLGVMEFFMRVKRRPDAAVLAMLAGVGGQVGQFIERLGAVEALRQSESHKDSMIKAALDCVVGMDLAGRVIEFNPAAERVFGYSREEAIGKEMCELIIPPSYRDAHRRGLARYARTGEGPMLEKRLEMTAVRRNGDEFPIDLTISRNPGVETRTRRASGGGARQPDQGRVPGHGLA